MIKVRDFIVAFSKHKEFKQTYPAQWHWTTTTCHCPLEGSLPRLYDTIICIRNGKRKMVVLLCSVLVGPYLDNWSSSGLPSTEKYKLTIASPEKSGKYDYGTEEKLRQLVLLSPKRRLRGDLMKDVNIWSEEWWGSQIAVAIAQGQDKSNGHTMKYIISIWAPGNPCDLVVCTYYLL